MEELLQQLSGERLQSISTNSWRIVLLFSHAILIGIILTLLTWWTNLKIAATPSSRPKPEADMILNASNVLFLCVGMTAVMILVNDSLARAFAVGAAIALVRFRIKVAGKFIAVALFYAVLTGMACGVDRLDVAWAVTLTFTVLLALVLTLRNLSLRRQEIVDSPTTASPRSSAAPSATLSTAPTQLEPSAQDKARGP